jgi:hypothetical protein
MNTIDHRILIPATQHVVWDYISSLENNPNWQVDCARITFLTTATRGPGTRYRYASETGREYVIEILTWYDRLGYEYTYIDGAPFKENRGRLRLQEIAEGTVVQWSFSFQPGGPLARGPLASKKSIESMMADSLWTLWRHVTKISDRLDPAQIKSLMREAPDAEARASYQPRHPSKVDEASRPKPPESHPAALIPEPPIEDDDTRPRPAVTEPAASLPPSHATSAERPVEEPDFLRNYADPPPAVTLPRYEPRWVIPEDDPTLDRELSAFAPAEPRYEPTYATPESTLSAQPSHDSYSLDAESLPGAPLFVGTQAGSAAEVPLIPEPPIDKLDTAQVSVFDLFGIPKPSETQTINPVVLSDDTPGEPPPSAMEPRRTAIMFQPRIGKRYLLRRQLVNLRPPEQ